MHQELKAAISIASPSDSGKGAERDGTLRIEWNNSVKRHGW